LFYFIILTIINIVILSWEREIFFNSYLFKKSRKEKKEAKQIKTFERQKRKKNRFFFSFMLTLYYSFFFLFFFWCLFNIAIVHKWIVKFIKIHSHTNLKLTSSNLHHSPKQHDDHLLNSHSSKKKKKHSSGTGSALLNTAGQDKPSANMFPGRSGPQVKISNEFEFIHLFFYLVLF